MKSFRYVTASTPESACELVGREGRFIAGGIDLLGEMKEGLAAPDRLVNVKALRGTHEITAGDRRWIIGANVTLATLANHPELRKIFPALTSAAATVGSPQMRNVASVGGNLAQHSRCWYYRHRDVHCAKKGGNRCFAHGGETKYHSLFSETKCISPCVSNLAIALSALGAGVVVQRGPETLALTMPQLYAAVWKNPRMHNSLEPGDLILRVEVPVVPGGRSVYLQMAEKSDFDWPLVSCAVAARLEGGKLHEPRIVLGGIATIPWEVAAANDALDNQPPADEPATVAGEQLLLDAQPDEHNAYKVPLAQALVRRAVARLA